MDSEGVIKYQLEFNQSGSADACPDMLNLWRGILHGMGLIGQDAARYGGFGFGNVSQRLDPGSSKFMISASQTGKLECLQARHYCRVDAIDFERQRVIASGMLAPSSEALSHAAIYALDVEIGCVLHVHHAGMWQFALDQGYPSTGAGVAYGTGAMAREILRLYRDSDLAQRGVLAMAGHQDGVISFGTDPDQAGARMLRLYVDAI